MESVKDWLRSRLAIALAFVAVVISLMAYMQPGQSADAGTIGRISEVKTTLSQCENTIAQGEDCAVLGKNDVQTTDIQKDAIDTTKLEGGAVRAPDVALPAVRATSTNVTEPDNNVASYLGLNDCDVDFSLNCHTFQTVTNSSGYSFGPCVSQDDPNLTGGLSCFRAPETGYYAVSLNVTWAASTSGSRTLYMWTLGANDTLTSAFVSSEGNVAPVASLAKNVEGEPIQRLSQTVFLQKGHAIMLAADARSTGGGTTFDANLSIVMMPV
jgi:hypothetical protein